MPRKRARTRFPVSLEKGEVGQSYVDVFPNELSEFESTSITARVGDAGTSEVQVVGITIPANHLQPGSTYRITATGLLTTDAGAGTSTCRVRCGTTTLTGTAYVTSSRSESNGATDAEVSLQAIFTVRTIGSSGTAIAVMWQQNAGGAFGSVVGNAQGTSTAIDTTQQRILELTYQTSDAGTNMRWDIATIEKLGS